MKFSTIALALAAVAAAPNVSAFSPVPAVGVNNAKTIHSSLFAADTSNTSTSSSPVMKNKPLIVVDEESGEDAISAPSVIREAASEDFDVLDNKTWFRSLPYGAKLTGVEKLRAEGLTGKGVRVAVIDSGVDADHPGFHGMVKEQVWFRYGSPLSKDDHGTHVAGTIHIMAPEAEIYDYRVFGDEGGRVDLAIARSIELAIDDGCDVINMSLGGPRANFNIGRAVQLAHSRGVPMIVAAGNEGDNNPLTNENSYPAMRPEVVSIAAVSKSDDLPVARFSNGNPQVDYSGIGVDVHSLRPGGGFQQMSGTSMATPHVCGLVAALLTEGGPFREMVSDDASLRKVLGEFTIDIGVKGPDNATGLGFLSYLNEKEYEQLVDGTSFWRKRFARPSL